jgi:hypothetical protein
VGPAASSEGRRQRVLRVRQDRLVWLPAFDLMRTGGRKRVLRIDDFDLTVGQLPGVRLPAGLIEYASPGRDDRGPTRRGRRSVSADGTHLTGGAWCAERRAGPSTRSA